jgi:GxxExxY protein
MYHRLTNRSAPFRVFRVFRGSFWLRVLLISPAMKSRLIYEAESYQIIGACFEVYREKGCGFLEPVYQECMEIELRLRGVPFSSQKFLALEYKGCPLRAKYQPDFICFEKIILELKAVSELADEHRAQVQNYLKVTGSKLGLLVNFGHYPKVEIERIVAERGRYDYSRERTAEHAEYAERKSRNSQKSHPGLYLCRYN